jgi:uncharacterized protein YjbI with pentapeptide repeats
MIQFSHQVRDFKDRVIASILKEIEIQKLRFGFKDENGNAITMSQFAPPLIHDSQFENNDARVSCLMGLDLQHSRFVGNRLKASQILGVSLRHSRMIENSLNSSTLNDLELKGQSSLQEVTFNGSHLNQICLLDGSFILTSRVEGSRIERFFVRDASIIENTRMSDFSLRDVEWNRVRIGSAQFYSVNMADSVWEDVDFSNSRFRNCRFLGTRISGVKLRDLKVANVDFSGLTIKSSEEFMDVFMGHKIFRK